MSYYHLFLHYSIEKQKPQPHCIRIAVIFEPYSLRATKAEAFGCDAPSCAKRHKARGAIFAASLTSELVDSALLGYLRRRFAASRRLANPFFSAKKKNTEHPKGYSVFLANDCNFDTNEPHFEVRGCKVILGDAVFGRI